MVTDMDFWDSSGLPIRLFPTTECQHSVCKHLLLVGKEPVLSCTR